MTQDELPRVSRDDPFLKGPLRDPSLADEWVVKNYLNLTYGGTKDPFNFWDVGDEKDVEELPLSGIEKLKRESVSDDLDYQEDLSSQIVSVAKEPYPKNTALLALPTGAGKTRTALTGIVKLFESSSVLKVLWLAPTRELLDQAFLALRTLWENRRTAPDLVLHRCHALKEFPLTSEPSVYFSTPQMIIRRWSRKRKSVPSFDFIVFDEAHHAAAPKFGEILTSLRKVGEKTIGAIGLSATPGRSVDSETENLVSLFHKRLLTSKLLYPNALKTLQDRGVLAKLDFKRIPLSKKLVGRIHVVESKIHLSGPVKNLESDIIRFKAIVKTVQEISKTNRVLVFAGSIAHANALGLVLGYLGCRCGVLTSNTSLIKRSILLEQFSKNVIPVIINKSILATGYDCPAVSNVVLSMPIGSPILFEQIIGRVSRGPKMGGDAIGTVWQIDNNLAIHGMPSSYHRYRDFDWE